MAKLAYQRQEAREAARSAGEKYYTVGGVIRGTGLKGSDSGLVVGKGGKDTDLKTGKREKTFTPTVISDNSIREEVIPQIKNEAQQLGINQPQGTAQNPGDAPQGQVSSSETQDSADNEYSALYQSVMGSTPAQDNVYDAELSLLDQVKATADASTRSYIDSLKQTYDARRAQVQASVGASQKGASTLLMSGGGYRSGSGSQVLSGIERAGIRELSTLDAEEQGLKAEALAAQTNSDYKVLGEKLGLMKEKRAEKLDTVAKMWQAQVDEKKETQKGINEVLKSASKNGAPASVINAISAATDQSSAIQAAGDYLQEGSGTVGEYLFYKREAQAAGQVPMSYQAYADMDANRKRSVVNIGGGSGTYSTNQEKVITRVDNAIANNPMYKKYNSMLTFANNVNTALDSGNGVSDIAAINQFQKVIDEGAVTRDQDVKLIQSAQSLSNQLSLMTNRLKSGQQLSATQREQMRTMVNDMLSAQKNAVDSDPFIQSKRKELERNSIDPTDTIIGGIDADTGGTGGDLIKQERDAESRVVETAASSPEAEAAIRPLLEADVPFLEIVEALPEYFN